MLARLLRRLATALLALGAAMAFAAVDVNSATQADLDGVKGIGPAIAGRIVTERAKGPYKDWQDLVSRVQGIGEKSAAKLSTAGLTVNGQAFAGAPAATTATARTSARTSAATPAAPATIAAPTTTAAPATPTAPATSAKATPAAVTAPAAASMSAADKKAARKAEREERKAMKAASAGEARPSRVRPASAASGSMR